MPDTVLVIGATGATGIPIVNALLKRPNTCVVALVRPSTLSDPSRSQEINWLRQRGVEVQGGSVRDDSAKMREWLRGVDVVVSGVVYGELLGQRRVVDVAKEVGVKRFIPSDFSTNCPSGIMALQGVKYIVQRHIIDSGIGYTFINSGSWYEVLLREIDGTSIRGGPYPVPPPTPDPIVYRVYGGGDKPNAVTHLPDVGEITARIIFDPRTLNRSVFIMGDAVTQQQMGQWYEAETGKRLKWEKVNLTSLHNRIRDLRRELPPLEVDRELPIAVLGLEYQLSRWVRGDNMPPAGALKSWELYPDYVCVKWRDWLREKVMARRVGVNML